MSDAVMIPLKVFGIGFAISMGISLLIKLLLDAITLFSRNKVEK